MTTADYVTFYVPEKYAVTAGKLSVEVYVNGVRQMLGYDYSLLESAGPGTGYDSVTFSRTLVPSDIVQADYIIATALDTQNFVRTNVVPLGAIDGANTTFLLPEKFAVLTDLLSVEVYVNGVRQFLNGDYTIEESVPGDGYDSVEMVYPPATTSRVFVDYILQA